MRLISDQISTENTVDGQKVTAESLNIEAIDTSNVLPNIDLSDDSPKENNEIEANTSLEEIDDDFFVFTFVDGLDQPIKDLQVKIDLPGSISHEAKTTENGVVVVPKTASEKTGNATVSVHDIHGKKQKVCELDMSLCTHGAVIRSPKVKVVHKDLPHHSGKPAPQSRPKAVPKPKSDKAGHPASVPNDTSAKAPPSDEPWYIKREKELSNAFDWLADKLNIKHGSAIENSKTNHPVLAGTNPAGNPVNVVVGPETGGEENLMLGENNRFRDFLIRAGRRLGMRPQVLAALINAEAGPKYETITITGKDGQPVLETKGKRKGKAKVRKIYRGWNENADNGMAAGLTQFLAGTWLDHVLKTGFFIHEQSIIKGWVGNPPVFNRG